MCLDNTGFAAFLMSYELETYLGSERKKEKKKEREKLWQ